MIYNRDNISQYRKNVNELNSEVEVIGFVSERRPWEKTLPSTMTHLTSPVHICHICILLNNMNITPFPAGSITENHFPPTWQSLQSSQTHPFFPPTPGACLHLLAPQDQLIQLHIALPENYRIYYIFMSLHMLLEFLANLLNQHKCHFYEIIARNN